LENIGVLGLIIQCIIIDLSHSKKKKRLSRTVESRTVVILGCRTSPYPPKLGPDSLKSMAKTHHIQTVIAF
jgi:hypothetical protein